MYTVNHDPIALLSGTDNVYHKIYTEAAEITKEDTPAAMKYIKKFIDTIEKISKDKAYDKRISDSKGNITKFIGYENIKDAILFLNSNLGKINIVKNLKTLDNKLHEYQDYYISGYDKQISIIKLEYESALFLLVSGLSFTIANFINIEQNGKEIKIKQKSGKESGLLFKSINDLVKQMDGKNHKDYLAALVKAKENKSMNESVFTEAEGGDLWMIIKDLTKVGPKLIKTGIKIFNLLKNNLFGIIPLIRTIIYLHYKKKADTINALEEQVFFVTKNIEQLKKIPMNSDKKETIIKKQEAYIRAYQNKAEKLRAQLVETEKDAAVALNRDKDDLKKDSPSTNDDFEI